MISQTHTHTRCNFGLYIVRIAIQSIMIATLSFMLTYHGHALGPIGDAIYLAVMSFAIIAGFDESARTQWEWARYLLSVYMAMRWGIVGGLRPPLGAPPWEREKWSWLRRSWYKLRIACWRTEDRMYSWTGLPDVWHKGYCSKMGLPR